MEERGCGSCVGKIYVVLLALLDVLPNMRSPLNMVLNQFPGIRFNYVAVKCMVLYSSAVGWGGLGAKQIVLLIEAA
jgi:hypothetical protein